MDAEAVLSWLETVIPAQTGERLSELQKVILQQVWQGRKYLEIANSYGCTEGHAKDVGSHLWKLLSKALRQKITKSNCRATLERYWKKTSVISNLLDTSRFAENFTIGKEQPRAEFITKQENVNFLGRTEAISHLNTLVNRGVKVIVIQGEGGVGKTTLAQEYLQTQGFDLVLELLMAKETQNITAAEHVIEEWLKQDFDEEPGIEFGVTLGRLKRKLHTCRVGVLIDNLEPALDRQGRFIAKHRNYVEFLRVLADARVQSVTLITSRDRLCEPEVNVEHYRLPGLDLTAWQQFFTKRELPIDFATLQSMHRAYGGNAKAMGILCGSIRQDFDGDTIAYWREHQAEPLAVVDLKNLVVSQINRLQALDPLAYRLLSRLGCYRYQDVPRIPKEGVFSLLWDVLPCQHQQILTSLKNRSLVECSKDEYWLHPAIRSEVISHLRISDEWEITNRKAAEFWTESIQKITTFKDALQALEAYYHYVEIHEFEWAGTVILKSRNNQWQQFLPLGSTLYRMGWLQPLIAAITIIIKNVPSDKNLSELYNILGDLYWIIGKVHAAIECQEKSINIAYRAINSLSRIRENKHKFYYYKMLEVDALLSIGLYKIDLWELDASAQLFQQVIDLAQDTDHHRWAEKATVCLALVNSYLGILEEARVLADKAYQAIATQQLVKPSGRFAYFMQILGQTYVNLKDFAKAEEMFRMALTFAEESHYTQVQAKTLCGIAEIYRQQAKFELAIDNHLEAIELLNRIGAKCDLAIADFQLGLTFSKIGKKQESRIHFDRAIRLFTEMQAPKQIEKIFKYLQI
ncbi:MULTISPECIES: tetratricopeptide repeat protein [Nostocales]|uniref:ATP-binding protein n=3 Tax=Nostocales TaxID=1161 RepID=A0A0C1R8Z4_9CYAN|nr:tetratricopeptide repeat protein [Tolypothrix bouteillei]KAF3885537.1 ATP-binding protein [Tolypothrix bouteillei VB521301]